MPRPRQNYTPPEKVAILKRHLLEKVAIPDLCEELGLNPTVFYQWQKVLFAKRLSPPWSRAFRRRGEDPRDRRIAALEQKLQQKNEVLAETSCRSTSS